MLESLGLSPTEEELYRLLLCSPASSARRLADTAGFPMAATRAGLARLVVMHLAERRPGRPITFVPAPPDIAITALLNQRQHDLDEARRAVPELMGDYQQGSSASRPDGLVEVCTGPDVGLRRFRELQAAASEELLLFDRVRDVTATGSCEVGTEAPMLGRGVRCRSIYEVSSLSLPGRLPHIRHLAALGEQSRVTRQLPMKMVICDRRLAMLPLAVGPQRTESVVLVEPSTLLDALVNLFEAYWQRSTPLWQATNRESSTGDFTPADLEVLRLLNTGLKDEAIARQLGVSMRTARRRISGALNALGATTRFQAGLAAAKRGLL